MSLLDEARDAPSQHYVPAVAVVGGAAQAYENDPACRSWSKAMEGWTPSVENRGMAENGDLLYMALNGGAR